METIQTVALFVLDPLRRGLSDLIDMLLYMAPALALAGIIYWLIT